ncbi:hypothetical protein [Paenibacillus sabinae]|uniref:Uncharacterized protein n=1 Tax=Paenibacillus sabinae T27 TaxID=1268072 RepID=X5A3T2_9BACL|nr:hypothetical protein [Paenibacillus sabinae]AHV98973.1 hypothetical protein PSAB_20410 [Paenibacillus sabinae T27]
MKARALLECTIDTASPAAELSATISAVLAVLPSAEQRLSVLRSLDDEIGRALAEFEAASKPQETEDAA